MDGGKMEREVAERLKQTVKQATNRRRAFRISQTRKRRQSTALQSPVTNEGPSSYTEPANPFDGYMFPQQFREAGEKDGKLQMLNLSTLGAVMTPSWNLGIDSSPTETFMNNTLWEELYGQPSQLMPDMSSINTAPVQPFAPAEARMLSNTPAIEEADLLMHYLDHVFYLQFRFYGRSTSVVGRGWLLSLLTDTKSLYHAILGLSAFHKQSMLLQSNDSIYRELVWPGLQNHVSLALEELQLAAKTNMKSPNRSLKDAISHLACMIQSIFLEVGSSDD
jgi:hypothetical protein